ncbi:hypothetical protein L915_21543 [Phytophthora nicotianae]|uniref:MULE transposase domain-containing protein n=1 Tax=Phytophthora nicotianae TaxID=4792 RepID=W2FMK3_PHYNI|nr:hypothetical protein L915_21543 [Phytophthora nicotianae]
MSEEDANGDLSRYDPFAGINSSVVAYDNEGENKSSVTVLDVCSSSGNDGSDEVFEYISDSSEMLEEILDAIDGPRSHAQSTQPQQPPQNEGHRVSKVNTRRARSQQPIVARSDSSKTVAETMKLDSSDECPRSSDQMPRSRRALPAQRDDLPDTTTDRTPRIRRSETYTERVSMTNSREDVVNKIAALPQLVFTSWSELNEVLKSYCSRHKLLFRARDTQTVRKHNSSKEFKIPIEMEYSYKVFRCTHGCHQKSRGAGHCTTPVRFTGCKARFTASVMDVGAEGDKPDRKIILRNWTWTHNHHTNNTIFAGYFGAESIPEDSRVLESVGLLADANAESHYVRDYLWGALERQVTPQQARNIVQRVLKNDSVEEQLTSMLDTLDKHEDHDVLVLRDQNDVTCGVVIQTAVQKIAFKKWGETLCMDWTYGTNNLGFHLVVIDKDFKEWRILEKCFPEATVLLCQFHAMKTWKKIVKTRKYGLNGIQQDEVENAIMKMMYSTTSAAFIRVRDDFENFCNGLCPDICNKPCAEIFMKHDDKSN